MRVIMTGGGTGGHIYPAIAIADEIKRRDPSSEILFVGTERGMERDIVPRSGYPIRFVTVQGLNRSNLLKNIETLKAYRNGLRQSDEIMESFRPDLVIGTGGYVCGPVVRSAYKKHIRTYIHEQNAFPGLANKMLSRHTDRVFMAFEEAGRYFKTKEPPLTVGNPVRSAFTETGKTEARRKLRLPEDAFVLLGFGGSLGAAVINREMLNLAAELAEEPDIYVLFATGRRYYKEIMEKPHPGGSNIRYLEYIDDMPAYLAACDLAITRSGALTVSEIAACGKPAVMIPSPNVTNNHQYYNAKVLADRGAAVLIEEKDLKPGIVSDTVRRLAGDRAELESMEAASRRIGRTDTAGIICDAIGVRAEGSGTQNGSTQPAG